MFLLVFLLFAVFTAAATDTGTGGCAPVTWTNEGFVAPSAPTISRPTPTRASLKDLGDAETGEINCRMDDETNELGGNDACNYLSTRWGVSLEKLLMLNPMLLGDCENMQLNTKYCVRGCKLQFCSNEFWD